MTWQLIQHHCNADGCHTHGVQSWVGVSSGSFAAPDHEYPSYLELVLTVTDSGGLTDTQSIRLDPRTVQLTLASSPGGMTLGLNAESAPASFTRTVIEGSSNSISAPDQVKNRTTYGWQKWSDGGARAHNVTANATATYTATFKRLR